MKAIKIDVVKQEVYEVEIDDSIQSIYKHLECDCFCHVGRRMENGDALLVDDNGLLIDNPIGAFAFFPYPQVLSGHGLLHGTIGPETSQVVSTVEEIKARVVFMPVEFIPDPMPPKIVSFNTVQEFADYLINNHCNEPL